MVNMSVNSRSVFCKQMQDVCHYCLACGCFCVLVMLPVSWFICQVCVCVCVGRDDGRCLLFWVERNAFSRGWIMGQPEAVIDGSSARFLGDIPPCHYCCCGHLRWSILYTVRQFGRPSVTAAIAQLSGFVEKQENVVWN
jgi:hypothetical protein